MAVDLHSFTSNFRGGGARNNLFQVQITNPVDASQDNILPFRCKSTNLPAWAVEEISTKFMGRSIYYAGVRTVEPWKVNIMEDQDLMVRNALESWQNWINLQKNNIRGFPTGTDDQYKSVAIINQLDKLDNIVRQYTLYNVWLQTLAGVELSWDNDTIVTYDATFRYDYFEVSGGTSGNAANLNQTTF